MLSVALEYIAESEEELLELFELLKNKNIPPILAWFSVDSPKLSVLLLPLDILIGISRAITIATG